MKFHVYFLTYVDKNIIYVGSTQELDKRLERHFRELNQGNHHNQILQANWVENCSVTVSSFECRTLEHAREHEHNLIKQLRINLPPHLILANIGNDVKGGDNLTFNPRRDEIISQMTKTIVNKYSKMSHEERKIKYARNGEDNGMFGKNHSLETRQKISNHHKGNSYCKGKKLAISHIEKIRERAKKLIGDKNPFFGKSHSQDSKKKMSEANKGKLPTNCKTVTVGNRVFTSLSEASRHFNISKALVLYRIRKDSYPEWNFN